jgi:hypothetical protein
MNDQDRLDMLRDRIGDISVRAFLAGGEQLVDTIDGKLEIALRHSDRIGKGIFPASKAILDEMEKSINYAEESLKELEEDEEENCSDGYDMIG